jgi:predicted nucleotidyltransferase
MEATNKDEVVKLNSVFELYPKIGLVYFFGSKAKRKGGPLSDYDFAVYLEEKDKSRIFDIKLDLQNKISRLLKTDKIDIVILNLTESPELKYNIIKEGNLIFQKEPYKLLVEPRILIEYFDFHDLLLRHNLTRA